MQKVYWAFNAAYYMAWGKFTEHLQLKLGIAFKQTHIGKRVDSYDLYWVISTSWIVYLATLFVPLPAILERQFALEFKITELPSSDYQYFIQVLVVLYWINNAFLILFCRQIRWNSPRRFPFHCKLKESKPSFKSATFLWFYFFHILIISLMQDGLNQVYL